MLSVLLPFTVFLIGVIVNYCGDNSWLNVQLWPDDEGERLLYGDQEVAFFAKLTGLNTVDVLIDFIDYKLTKRSILPFIKSFLCRLSVIPISSAACERGFSAMNAQKSPTRNRLLMKNLDGILFVSVNDMPLNCWDPKRILCHDLVKIWST